MVRKANGQFEESFKIQEHQGNNITNANSKSEKLSGNNFLRLESECRSTNFLLPMCMLLFILGENVLQIGIRYIF